MSLDAVPQIPIWSGLVIVGVVLFAVIYRMSSTLNLRSPPVLAIIGVIASLVLALAVVIPLLMTGGPSLVSKNAALIGALIALGGVFTAQLVTTGLASQRAQEDALEKYFEDIGKLLADPDRPLRRSTTGDDLSTVARAHTLSTLEALTDPNRKRLLLQFLYESGLISSERTVVNESGLISHERTVVILKDANLRGANLKEANLSRAILVGANLSRANLGGANLIWGYVHEASLRNAYMGDANLRSVNLSNTDLRDASLGDANLRKASMDKADLRGAWLYNADMREAVLDWANLQNVWLTKTDLRNASLRSANLSDAILNGVKLGKARLNATNVTGANLGTQKRYWWGRSKGARGLTQEQIDLAIGDQATLLPASINRPKRWTVKGKVRSATVRLDRRGRVPFFSRTSENAA